MGKRRPDRAADPEIDSSRENEETLPHLAGVKHYFLDLPGLRMHVAEAGSGEPLLLLHGFPQHWWAWRKMIPALAEHYRVICPDLRGAGWTDAPADGYTNDQLVADVVALLDALRLETVHVVGYDWGALLGYRLCLSQPHRVERFIPIAAPHPYPEFHPRMLLSLWKLWPMLAIATPVLGARLLRSGRLPRWQMTSDTQDRSVWSEEDLDIFVSRLRDPARARAGSALYRDFILAEAKRSGAYRGTRLRTPTLSLYGSVLYGGNDPSREHPEIVGGYEDYADDFTLQHVPGAGYYIPEEQPDAVVAHTLEFFARG
ncbi:alpha/beta hydrolase [Mycetocola sp. 2940]|uniref:alpha/beta fold hydrolase n=1 Tax=Mycetocola sp. 2940 TaxID=3156452 RepID=UPI00339954B1